MTLAAAHEPLAVIGLACRFPGSIDTPRQFWDLLVTGRDALGPLPRDRWEMEAWTHPDPARPGRSYSPQGGFLDHIDRFDAAFFGISPREACRMDPQQRMLLELTWEALEDAGQPAPSLAGTETAVFVGMSAADYQHLQFLTPETTDAYSNPGSANSIAANRLSYIFDLHGPSMAVDTACSSSLVALHLACETLRSGRSPIAIAAGVNLLLSPFPFVGFSKASMLSASGRCHTFDASADGYVRSEGGGVLVIKPLKQALKDGDPIRALIIGSGTNTDGRTSGMLLPSAQAQAQLLRRVYDEARIDPRDICYVEAHGTGTQAGDPIECEGISRALTPGRRERLMVGSVKTNIGHLEAASGVAGAMKVIMSLQQRVLPPTIGVESLNPALHLDSSGLDVVTGLTCLHDRGGPLVMGVNSFGFGGANAHVVFQDFKAPAKNGNTNGNAASGPALPILISARDEDALKVQASAFAQRLTDSVSDADGGSFEDIRYTAAMRRAHHPYRLAVFGETATETAERLLSFVEHGETEFVTTGKVQQPRARTAFVFSGNGSQWEGMGRELLQVAPAFRQAVARVDALFQPLAGWSLIDLLERTERTPDTSMARTEIAQPALFAMQVGLVDLLATYGITPHAVMGHSVGEVAAAYVAGILTIEQAVRVIYERSRAQGRTAGIGAMAACGLSDAEAQDVIARSAGKIELAGINSPRSTTLSGDRAALVALGEELTPQGKFYRLLDLDYAFHSQAMDPIQDDLERALDGLTPGVAALPFYSTTTGIVEAGPALDARYWWNNVRHPVLFGQAVGAALADDCSAFVEIGPHAVLDPYVRQCLETSGRTGQSLTTLRRNEPEWPRLLAAVARCHVIADIVDLETPFGAGGHCVPLPSYPWQRKRHWNGGTFSRTPLEHDRHEHPLLGYRTVAAEPVWENEVDTGQPSLASLVDHRVLGSVVLPAAAIVEMAMKAAALYRGTTAIDIQNLDIRRPLVLPSGQPARVQFAVSADDGQFAFRSRVAGDDAGWMLHAIGTIATPTPGVRPSPVSIAALRARLGTRLSASAFYDRCIAKGLQYGPAFQRVREVWTGSDEALASLDAAPRADETDFIVPPAVLDACLQVALAAPADAGGSTALYLPAQLKQFRLFAPADTAAWCHAQIQRRGSRSIVVRLTIYDVHGEVVAIADGLRARRMESVLESSAPLLEMRAEAQAHPRSGDTIRTEPRTWLLLGGGPLASTLRDRLIGAGHRVVEGALGETAVDEVLYAFDPLVDAGLRAAIDDSCVSALTLAQMLSRRADAKAPRVWFLTRNANPTPDAADVDPRWAPVWGLRRVLAQEMPALECRTVDLQGDLGAGLLDRALLELIAPTDEDEVLLTPAQRYVHRLVHQSLAAELVAETVPAGDAAYKVALTRPGSPDNLAVERCERPAPSADQIEIRVRATGLNFHDVMWTMGLLQDEAVETGFAGPTLGMECAGVVARVGANVIHVKPGDPVIAFAPQCFSAYVMATASDVFPAPVGMSLEEAATLLIAHCTSVYALETLARLQPGERVLIHGAAGGVGLAAIQYAQHVGAIVFATAGTDAKREYLRQLGVEPQHIFNSRTAEFAEQILAVTDGEGVDVALNSLSGDAIARTMAVLRPFGRFLELGKRDFFESSRMNLAPFRNNLSYFGIDLDQALAVRADFRRTVIPRVLELIRERALRPLPVKLFPVSQSRDAFRYMQKAEHIGKIVVSFDDPDLRLPRERTPFVARPDGTYVIAGGVSGLGLASAVWLADRGAGHLLLLSRSGTPTADARATIDRLRAHGVDVVTERVDISDAVALDNVLDAMRDRLPPVRGVVQAAMVLEDGPAEQMTPERFWRAASPKILGTWNLHQLTQESPLDFFVMYSSATTCLGNPGQANYVAGNAFMEALAHHRRARGLPATAISWGAISDTGYLARNARVLKILERRIALRPMTAAQALACLDPLLSLDRANPIVADLDWAALAGPEHALVRAPRFARLVADVRSGSEVPGVDLQAMLIALPPDEARSRIEQLLAQDLAPILGSDAALDPRRPLAELGLDSLMAVELMTAIERRYRVQFGAMEIMGTTTVAQVAERILVKVQAGAGSAPVNAMPLEQEIDALSDDAVDALLANLMGDRNSTEITE